MVRIGDLYDARVDIQATVDRRALGETAQGVDVRPAVPAFMTAPSADVYRVVTKDGYEIKATEWHDFYTTRGKIKLKDLRPGDELLIQSGKGQFGSKGSAELGMLLGLLTGDGHFTNRGNGQQAAVVNLWGLDRALRMPSWHIVNALIARCSDRRPATIGSAPSRSRSEIIVMIRSVLLMRLLEYNMALTAQGQDASAGNRLARQRGVRQGLFARPVPIRRHGAARRYRTHTARFASHLAMIAC